MPVFLIKKNVRIINELKSMCTHFDLVKGAQTMIPGWNHVMKYAVKECHEPAQSKTTLNDLFEIHA